MRRIILSAFLIALWSCAPEKLPDPAPAAPENSVPAVEPPAAPVVVAEPVAPAPVEVPPPITPEPVKKPPVTPPPAAVVEVPEVAPPPQVAPPPEEKKAQVPVFLQFSFKELTPRSAVDREGRKVVLTVPYGTSLAALTPVYSTNNAKVFLEGSEVTSGTQVLSWSRPLKFLLISEDALEESWTVEVAVTPANRDSKLGSVAMGTAQLIPPFDPAVASYSLFVPTEATTLNLTAAPSFPKAKMTIQVNDGLSPVPLEAGKGLNLALTPGENNLFLKVTAEDGRANTYYVFVVKRR